MRTNIEIDDKGLGRTLRSSNGVKLFICNQSEAVELNCDCDRGPFE